MGRYRGGSTHFVFDEHSWHGLGSNYWPKTAFDLDLKPEEIQRRVPGFRCGVARIKASYATMWDEVDGIYTLHYVFEARSAAGGLHVEPFTLRVSHMHRPRRVLSVGRFNEVVLRAIEALCEDG